MCLRSPALVNCLWQMLLCVTSLMCVTMHAASDTKYFCIVCHKYYICVAFHQYEITYVLGDNLLNRTVFHTHHTCVASLLCASTSALWDVRFWRNSQILHMSGFSPACVNMCCLRFPARANYLLHMSDLCAFSPVCISICVFRVSAGVKCLSQILHIWGFSPAYINMFFLRVRHRENSFPQILQTCGLSPVCVNMCCLRFQSLYWQCPVCYRKVHISTYCQ